MTMRTLAKTDLQISELCLGGNVFGWTADEAESFAVLDAARDGMTDAQQINSLLAERAAEAQRNAKAEVLAKLKAVAEAKKQEPST